MLCRVGSDSAGAGVDGSGKVGRAVNPAGNQASQLRDWTAWHVSLADLAAQGVNLKAMKKLNAGLDDKAVASGAGKIYADDVRLLASQ